MRFSVVIPTLNEAVALPSTLESVSRASDGQRKTRDHRIIGGEGVVKAKLCHGQSHNGWGNFTLAWRS
jgi:hypothetical protein